MLVITEFIDSAMKQAICERLESGEIFCTIPEIRGPYGAGSSKKNALAELRAVFEEWLVAALRDDEDLPEAGGISLNFAGKRWQDQSSAATSSLSFEP